MTVPMITPPFPLYSDIDGTALEDGYIWIGQRNLQPQTNPLAVYWDSALTQPAPQPLRTINGFIANAGTPARIFQPDLNYSILVQDKNGSFVYQALDVEAYPGGQSLLFFDSVESLRASQTSADHVETASFYAGGVAGGAKFRKNGTTGTPTAAGAANISAAIAANVFFNAAGIGYTLSKDQEIRVEMFGALWDDATDDTQFVQNAINWANIAALVVGRITIKCPKGGCRITALSFASMVNGIVFEGEDRIASFFRYTNPTGNVFDFTNARFVTFRKFQLLPLTAALKTAGHLFHVNNGDDLLFEHLRLNSSWEGFYISDAAGSSSQIWLKDVVGVDFGSVPWNWLVRISGACSAIKLDDVLLQTSATLTGGMVLIEKNGAAQADTVRMFRVDSQKFSAGLIPYGIRIEGGDFIHLLQCMHEVGGASGICYKITDGNNIHILDCHATTSLRGLEVDGGKGLQVIGGRYYFCQQEGMRFNGGSCINVCSAHILDNSQAAADTYDYVNAANANVIGFKFVGNTIDGVRSTFNRGRHGVNVAGAVGSIQVEDNRINAQVVSVTGRNVNYLFSSASSANQQLIVLDNSGGPAADVVSTHARARTSDATPTQIWTLTLNDNEHLNIVANVLCQGSSGTSTAGYIRAATAYRDGGAAVIEGAVTAIHTAEPVAGLDATITVSGNDLRVTVTGLVGNTYDWHVNVSINGKTSSA